MNNGTDDYKGNVVDYNCDGGGSSAGYGCFCCWCRRKSVTNNENELLIVAVNRVGEVGAGCK